MLLLFVLRFRQQFSVWNAIFQLREVFQPRDFFSFFLPVADVFSASEIVYTSGINTEIKVNGQKLETVTRFKYQGSVITDEGSKPETLSRIAQTTAASTRLKPV